MAQVQTTYIAGVTLLADDADPNVANLNTLRTRAQTALANNATYLAIVSPTTAQAVTQVAALTRQTDGIIRLLLQQFATITDA